MNRLLTIQDQFQSYLLNDQIDFEKLIVDTEKVPAKTRLAIYHNAYRSRLIEALESNYPVLKIYVGDDLFENIACEYINQHPSTYHSIRWFGDHLSHFLHEAYKGYPYVVELAQFEWMQTLVFDAADSNILQMEEMAKLPPIAWANMRLRPHPTLHRINTSWNSISIWQAIQENENPPEPIQYSTPIPQVLWRRDLINRCSSLTADEAWSIDAVLKGNTFSEICEGLCQWVKEEEAGQHAASLLKGWIQSGLLAEVVVGD